MSPQIWIPTSARPKWACTICGTTFHADERRKRERHVKKCAADNIETILAAQKRHDETLMHRPEWADQEFEDYFFGLPIEQRRKEGSRVHEVRPRPPEKG